MVDAALAFEVHSVEDLGMHLALGEGAGELEEAVRERGFAVIDVRDDREVADVFVVHRKGAEISDQKTVIGTK